MNHILLSTESDEAINSVLKGTYKGWVFSYSNTTRVKTSLQEAIKRGAIAAGQETQNSLTNLLLAVEADFLICTPSSNWCRTILRYALALRGHLPRYAFMDKWSHDVLPEFPGENMRQALLEEMPKDNP